MGIHDDTQSVSTECQACPLYRTKCTGRPAHLPCRNELSKRVDNVTRPDMLDDDSNNYPSGISPV